VRQRVLRTGMTENMVWADYAILIIVALSAVISVWRGFVKEALSLLGLIAAFWVALGFQQPMASLLAPYIEAPSLQLIAAFALLFVSTLIIAGLINHLAGQLVKKSGLSGTDRFIGILFGIARGIVLVAILVLLAGLTAIPADPWWKESIFIVHFQDVAIWIRSFLPADIAENIHF
jgi:membrane protein required for colicin V production